MEKINIIGIALIIISAVLFYLDVSKWVLIPCLFVGVILLSSSFINSLIEDLTG